MLLPLSLAVTCYQAKPTVSLTHTFVAGEKLAYQVMSHITAEQRGLHLETWLPSDFDINYNFSYAVKGLRPDGIAVIHYERPTMTEIEGETADSPPKEHLQKTNFDFQLTLSPINEILEQKKLGKEPSSFHQPINNLTGGSAARRTAAQGALGFFAPFILNLHRMAMFIGGVDESLDFSPKFPLRPVHTGDTWKKTVGYEPQRLKGHEGKQAIQRLDYTYTYLGPMTSNNKSVLRVEGKLSYASDAAEYLKQLLGDQASETNVTKAPMNFESTIDFDLDPKTKDLLHAQGSTTGGYHVFIKEQGDTAAFEERFKGQTTIDLIGRKMVGETHRR